MPSCETQTDILFTIYSLYVHFIFTAYSLHFHYMFTTYSLYIHCIFTICSLYIHYMFTVYSLYIHHMFTICSLYIHYIFTIYSLYIHNMFTIYSLYIHYIFFAMEASEGYLFRFQNITNILLSLKKISYVVLELCSVKQREGVKSTPSPVLIGLKDSLVEFLNPISVKAIVPKPSFMHQKLVQMN